MDRKTTRRALWACALLTVPVPFWAFERGRAPAVWLVEVGTFTAALWAREGGFGPALATALFLGEAALAAVLLALLARLATRLLARGRERVPARTVAAIALALVLLSALVPIYRTPLVADGAPLGLIGILSR